MTDKSISQEKADEQAFERLRRWPRAAVHMPVSFGIEHGPVTDVGGISDLSEGGLRLISASAAKPGDILNFELVFVPGLAAHQFRGTVIWRYNDVFGIEFARNASAKDQGRHVLRRVVSYHLGA